MFIKFNKSLNDIDYIIAFDLALYNTGVSIYDIKNKKIIKTEMICVNKNAIQPAIELYDKLSQFFDNIKAIYGENIMVLQESMPQQAGKFTTVATLQGLAKAHAMLELVVFEKNISFYDEKGVHSVSVKALFKTEDNQKPSKKDIKKVVSDEYGYKVEDLTDDQSDSMALIYTLLNKKWNSDIDQGIKDIKKEIKALKMVKVIEERKMEIEKLLSFKI